MAKGEEGDGGPAQGNTCSHDRGLRSKTNAVNHPVFSTHIPYGQEWGRISL